MDVYRRFGGTCSLCKVHPKQVSKCCPPRCSTQTLARHSLLLGYALSSVHLRPEGSTFIPATVVTNPTNSQQHYTLCWSLIPIFTKIGQKCGKWGKNYIYPPSPNMTLAKPNVRMSRVRDLSGKMPRVRTIRKCHVLGLYQPGCHVLGL